MGKDKESDDGNDFIAIFKVGYKESLLTTLFYSFVILMSYFLRLVWLWLFLDSENTMWVFSARYHQTNTSSSIQWPRKPRKPPDPIEGINHGHITDLNKVKLNIVPVIYLFFPHDFIVDVVPGTYGILKKTVLLNMWFLYLIGLFFTNTFGSIQNKTSSIFSKDFFHRHILIPKKGQIKHRTPGVDSFCCSLICLDRWLISPHVHVCQAIWWYDTGMSHFLLFPVNSKYLRICTKEIHFMLPL